MEQWLTTLDTKEAAAFGTLGCTIKIVPSLHQRTSTRTVRFLISRNAQEKNWNIGKIRRDLANGSLLRHFPAHPVITMLRAFANRAAFLGMMKSGAKFRLIAIPGSGGVWQFGASDTGLPGVAGQAAAVRTTDLKLAAALATVGFQPLRITGDERAHEFTIQAFHQPAPDQLRLDAAQLVADWRADPARIPFELPFAQAMRFLTNYEALRTEVSRSIDTILISKPNTTSHAAIRADANNKAWDKAKTFFSGIQ